MRFAVLASETDPFDPMEKAFKELGRSLFDDRGRTAKIGSWCMNIRCRRNCWRSPMSGNRPTSDEYIIATKGAPEADGRSLPFRFASNVDNCLGKSMPWPGMDCVFSRLLKRALANPWPSSQHEFDFEFLGLIGLADPVRPAVPTAIKEC